MDGDSPSYQHCGSIAKLLVCFWNVESETWLLHFDTSGKSDLESGRAIPHSFAGPSGGDSLVLMIGWMPHKVEPRRSKGK